MKFWRGGVLNFLDEGGGVLKIKVFRFSTVPPPPIINDRSLISNFLELINYSRAKYKGNQHGNKLNYHVEFSLNKSRSEKEYN
jgi:hypothetical protein